MVEPLRHRQTKEAATDMFSLQQPRHIPTLPFATASCEQRVGPCLLYADFVAKVGDFSRGAPAAAS